MGVTTTTESDLFELFSEYSGMPIKEVREAAHNYGGVNEVHWQECDADTWEERARQFYNIADGYVFDLINGNRSKAHLQSVYEKWGHWPWITKSGPEVLEFGGGLGLACSLFRDLGRKVTYVDIDSSPSRFARWYYERTQQTDIEVLITPQEGLVLPEGRQWDFVFSDAVLEHIIDPAPTVERLARAVRPGGMMYLIIDAHNVGPGFPMHKHVYLDELMKGSPTLRSMQHVLHDGDGLNAFVMPE